jgi:hypothetical protein
MKSLLALSVLLLINLGCGGYGSSSSMSMTPVAPPQIAPNSGTYATPLTVMIRDTTPNAVIYITTDGTMPTLSSPVYQGPFSLTHAGAAKVEAIAAAGGYSTSPVAVANFTLQ